MPIYSNVAFQILAHAIEDLTNKSFEDAFRSSIVDPLSLNGTYLTTPKPTPNLNGIIPSNQMYIPWNLDGGDGTSSG